MDLISLKRNDFESVRAASFNDLRQASLLFDVTLCCDNGVDTISAHKVILAANSTLFRRILGQHNSHQSMFLYLKGIHLKELEPLLDFMYLGQMSVERVAYDKILAVAAELEVQGIESVGSSDETLSDNNNSDGSPTRNAPPENKKAGKATKRPKRKVDLDATNVDDMFEALLKKTKVVSAKSITDDGLEATTETKTEEPSRNAKDISSRDDSLGAHTDMSDFTENESGTNSGVDAPLGEARFLKSRRGFPVLVDSEGYTYLKNTIKEDLAYWVCQYAKAGNCRGTVVTKGFHIAKRNIKHQHEPKLLPRKAAESEFEEEQTSFEGDYSEAIGIVSVQ